MYHKNFSAFAEKIRPILKDYKKILKRLLSLQKSRLAIQQLHLKNRHLLYANDIALYDIAQNVLKHLQKYLTENCNTPIHYSGVEAYYQLLKSTLEDYYIANKKIISQRASTSRALVEIIQLAKIPKSQRNEDGEIKIKRCREILQQFGSQTQLEKLQLVLDSVDKR